MEPGVNIKWQEGILTTMYENIAEGKTQRAVPRSRALMGWPRGARKRRRSSPEPWEGPRGQPLTQGVEEALPGHTGARKGPAPPAGGTSRPADRQGSRSFGAGRVPGSVHGRLPRGQGCSSSSWPGEGRALSLRGWWFKWPSQPGPSHRRITRAWLASSGQSQRLEWQCRPLPQPEPGSGWPSAPLPAALAILESLWEGSLCFGV